MKMIQFQGHDVVASHVVSVGPVEPDAELGQLAFTIFLSGGVELTFKQGKSYVDSRESFLTDLELTP